MKLEKRHYILGLVLILIVISIFYLQSQKAKPVGSDGEILKVNNKPETKLIGSQKYELAPELAGISGYLNTNDEEINISDYEGKVVLIDFWTYTCINCIRTLPYITSWDEKYRDKGLIIIGVHTPEFDFEKDKANVQSALDKYGIKYPVVQDNDYQTWNAFKNRYWPAKYLIDSGGYIRYTHFGEGNYEETEMQIQELLGEIGSDTSSVGLTEEESKEYNEITPELYAGVLFSLQRNQFIGNKVKNERTEDYVLPSKLNLKDTIYLDGTWTYNTDNLQLVDDSGIIALDFTASEVNIVADKSSSVGKTEMDILIDGNYISKENAGSDVKFDSKRAYVVLDGPRLYNVYSGNYGEYRLDLKVSGKDFTFNAFTFG